MEAEQGYLDGGREAAGRTEVRGEGGGKTKENTAFMKMQWWNPLLHMLTLKIVNIDARFITFKPKWPLFSCPWTLHVSCLQSLSVLHNPSHAWSSAASLEIRLELSPAFLCSAWPFFWPGLLTLHPWCISQAGLCSARANNSNSHWHTAVKVLPCFHVMARICGPWVPTLGLRKKPDLSILVSGVRGKSSKGFGQTGSHFYL